MKASKGSNFGHGMRIHLYSTLEYREITLTCTCTFQFFFFFSYLVEDDVRDHKEERISGEEFVWVMVGAERS